MPKLQKLFADRKKAALTIACIGVILVTIGVCIVVYAAGGPEQSSAIGRESAQNFAFADAGVDPAEAQAVQVKFEHWQGKFVYEVEFLAGGTEYEYKIDSEDGSVVKKETKTVKGPEATMPQPGAITLEQARGIALDDAGLAQDEVTFTQAEEDMEGIIPVFEFTFYAGNVEYEYEINARTGAVYSKGTTTYVGQAGGGTQPSSAPVQSLAPVETASPSPAASASPRPAATASPRPTESIVSPPTAGIAPPTPPAGVGQSRTQIGLDAAKEAALVDAGVSADQAVYKKAKLDYDDGVPVYEIEFYTDSYEYEYEIDAYTGVVCCKSVETCAAAGNDDWHHGDTHHSGGTGTVYIGEEQAKSAALDHAGFSADQVTFAEVKLDYDDGVYEIKFYRDGLEYEYEIDAATGAVIEFEWENHWH